MIGEREHYDVTGRLGWLRPDPQESCSWCGRRRGALLPLRATSSAGPGLDLEQLARGLRGVCAGPLGAHPYHPATHGPACPGR